MKSSARARIRSVYRDTIKGVSSSWITLFITCISSVILGGTDDSILVQSTDVTAPFVGKTSYEIFMVLAPVAIFVLRLYIDLQTVYLKRLSNIVARHNLIRPITINATNSTLVRIVGAFGVHLLPPFAIAYLGHHFSAIYPIYALVLYGVAAALVTWSALLILCEFDLKASGLGRRVAGALVTSALVVTLCGFAASKDFFVGEGSNLLCEKRYDGAFAEAAATIMRRMRIEHWNLAGLRAPGKNLTCAYITNSDLTEAQLQDARFWQSIVVESDLSGSKLTSSEFRNSEFRNASFIGSNAIYSEFVNAQFDHVSFVDAQLDEVWFRDAQIDNTCFTNANLKYAFFTNAEMFKVSFSDEVFPGAVKTCLNARCAETGHCAILSHADFREAELRQVNFNRARMNGADFFKARLVDVTFHDADLSCARFTDTAMEGVDFSRVPAAHLKQMEYKPASEESVRWPDAFERSELGSEFDANCQ